MRANDGLNRLIELGTRVPDHEIPGKRRQAGVRCTSILELRPVNPGGLDVNVLLLDGRPCRTQAGVDRHFAVEKVRLVAPPGSLGRRFPRPNSRIRPGGGDYTPQ